MGLLLLNSLGGSKCGNCTGTVSRVFCREVYYTVSLFGRVHYRRFQCNVLTSGTCRRVSH